MPDNLPQAITEPEKVIPPIKIVRNTVKKISESVVARAMGPIPDTVAQPSSKEAAPPKPLNSDTISGICVISTVFAFQAP